MNLLLVYTGFQGYYGIDEEVLKYDAQGNLNGKLSSVRYGTTRMYST